jgi:hypothetical protein
MGPSEWAFKEETRVWNREALMRYIIDPTILDETIHQTWGYLVRTFGKKLGSFKDITGGYAETLEGEIIYSADYYDKSMYTFVSRIFNKAWSLRVKFLSK